MASSAFSTARIALLCFGFLESFSHGTPSAVRSHYPLIHRAHGAQLRAMRPVALAGRRSGSSAGQHVAGGELSASKALQRVGSPAAVVPLPLRRDVATHAKEDDDSDIPDPLSKVVSSLVYLIPLLDGLRYGKFLFRDVPAFGIILAPLSPIIKFYFSLPLGGLLVFFGLYFGIANNQGLERFVRFNGMQAVLLDIILNVPSLAERYLLPSSIFSSELGVWSYAQVYNTIFLYIFGSVLYGAVSSLQGKAKKIPLVGNAADASANRY